GFPVGYANCVARTDRAVAPRELLGRAADFFAPPRRGDTLFVRGAWDADLEAELQRTGVPSLVDTPCMLIDRPLPPPASGCELRVVAGEADAEAAREVNAEAYQSLGLPADETRTL